MSTLAPFLENVESFYSISSSNVPNVQGTRSLLFLDHNDASLTHRNLINSANSSLLTYVVALIVFAIFGFCSKRNMERSLERQEELERQYDSRNQVRLDQLERHRKSVILDRSKAIENALIVKQIIGNSDSQKGPECLILGNPEMPKSGQQPQPQTSEQDYIDDDSDDDEESSCAICLKPFRVGDLVACSRRSISSQEKLGKENVCLHVFHQNCIQPWLVSAHHDECPTCRTKLLQLNDENFDPFDPRRRVFTTTRPQSSHDVSCPSCKLDVESQQLEPSGFLVIMNGLISRLQLSCPDKGKDDHKVCNPLGGTSNHSVSRPRLNHTVSLIDLGRMRRGLSTGHLDKTILRSQLGTHSFHGPASLRARGDEEAFEAAYLSYMTSFRTTFDRRSLGSRKSTSELPRNEYQGTQTHSLQSAEVPPEILPHSLIQSEHLACPMGGDTIANTQGITTDMSHFQRQVDTLPNGNVDMHDFYEI